MRVILRGAQLPRVTQPFNPRFTTQLWSSWAPSTVLLPKTCVLAKQPATCQGLLALTSSWVPAAPVWARTACPLCVGGAVLPVAPGSEIRPLGSAIGRKHLGRTGSHGIGQPRPRLPRPIRGQIFWEPLYKPRLSSELFPGEARAFTFFGSPCHRRGCRDTGTRGPRAAGASASRVPLPAGGPPLWSQKTPIRSWGSRLLAE